MSDFWCDVIIAICGFLLAVLSFVDSITKKSFEEKSKFLQRTLALLKQIRIKIIVIIVLAGVTVYAIKQKNINSEDDKREAANIFQKELDKRDSINQHNFQESLKKSSSAASSTNAETMAKYYLLYDSAQHKIERIVKDSTKRSITTNSYSDAKPDLDISDIRFIKSRNDTLEFKITVNCKKTAIENLNLKLQLYLLKGGILTYCPQINNFIPPNVNMSSNTSKVADNVNITSLKNIFEAYFHISGSYEFNNQRVPVDFILFYNFRESNFGIPGMKEYFRGQFNQQL